MPADEVTLWGEMRSGQPVARNRAYAEGIYRAWPEGETVSIRIRRERPKISDLQRGYYFAVVVPMIAEETGNDEDVVHEELKRMFLPKVTKIWRNKKTGKRRQLTTRPSLMNLNSKQAAEYTERIRIWAAEDLNLLIPEPDPRWKEKRSKEAA
jgi:hypothetical protein